MTDEPNDNGRRTVIQALAGLALAQAAGGVTRPAAAEVPGRQPGKPGDFDFLTGSWNISNRKRRKPGVDEWDEYKGESTVHGILAGIASIEELRIPVRNFSGMGLRLLDVEKKVWSDFWVNSKSGVLDTGTPGYFENGAGIFVSEDQENGKPVQYRGIWDRITKTSCRWYSGMSRDGGKTWEDDWFMDWVRV